MVFDHFDERFKEVPMQEFCLFASDMRVRMLVRASMYASSCMCAVARMCAWFSAYVSVLALACMLTPTSVFASVLVCVLLYVYFVQDCVCVSASSSPASSMGYVQGITGIRESSARGARF